jgi:ribulose-phosphate 3-epimerase
LQQLKEQRARRGLSYRIAVDGGIGADNVADAARAGAQILVAGTSVFHAADPGEAFRKLKHLALEAVSQKV